MPRSTELDKRLIVEAVGLDAAPDGGYAVTLQTLDLHAAGAQNERYGTEKSARLFRFTGETPGAALARVPAATGLTPLYSQARLLVLGRDVLRRPLQRTLDLFLREYNTRGDVLLAAAEGQAADLLAADFGTPEPGALFLEETLLRAETEGTAPAVQMYRFMDLLYSETDAAFCPVLGLKDTAEQETKLPALCGTAFFADGRYAFTADAAATAGLLYLTGRTKSASLTVRGADGTYTLRLLRAKKKLRTRRTETGFAFTFALNAAFDVTEFASDGPPGLGETQAENARRAAEEELTRLLRRSFDLLYYEKRADVCRLFRLAQLRRPKAAADWRGRMYLPEHTRMTFDVRVTVRRTGMERLRKSGS